eukprot:jgi/Phyca11/17078/fgenesh1_pg.PHYCAscaffold_24_\
MTKITTEGGGDAAPSQATVAPATSHERIGPVTDTEEKRATVTHEKDDGADAGDNAPRVRHTTEDLVALIQGVAKQMDPMKVAYEKLSESQQMMRHQLEADTKFGGVHRVNSQRMNSGLFASGLGRGSRMHIDSLGGSPQTPVTRSPVRAAQPPGNEMPLSHLRRLHNAAQMKQAAAERAVRAAEAAAEAQGGPGGQGIQMHGAPAGLQQQQQQAVRYPDARQKKLTIRPFGGKELYVGLGSGFLEWGRRFERQKM